MADHVGRNGTNKGVIVKLFGVVLVFLGILDGMLSWRGGLQADTFYVWLMAGGLLLYGAGAIRRGRQPDDLPKSRG